MADAHAHAHSHSHAHAHVPTALAGDVRAQRALLLALLLGVVVLAAEVIAGIVFGSLALLGDAAHMLTDVAAYGIALWAARAASRAVSATRTYGHGRVEILAALTNGATLLAASAWILIEAVRRLIEPRPVEAAGMTAMALIGLVANAAVLLVLLRSGSSSLNMRGALLHAAGDLLGSLAAATAGIVILVTGFERADPIASIMLTLLIVAGAWRLVRSSADVLLDAAPAGTDAARVGALIVEVPGVVEVHDVHVWTMSPGAVAASAHARIDAGADPSIVLRDIGHVLRSVLGIEHSTIQLQVDRGSLPLEAVPLMDLDEAVAWATDHVARVQPELSRPVISAAAGAAAVSLVRDGRVSPVTLAQRTLMMLGRSQGVAPDQA